MRYCRRCGASLSADDVFCGSCGTRADGPAEATTAPSEPVTVDAISKPDSLGDTTAPAPANPIDAGDNFKIARVWAIPLLLLGFTLFAISSQPDKDISAIVAGFPFIAAALVWQYGERPFFSSSEFLRPHGSKSWKQPIGAAVFALVVLAIAVGALSDAEENAGRAIVSGTLEDNAFLVKDAEPVSASIIGTWTATPVTEQDGDLTIRLSEIKTSYRADGTFISSSRAAFQGDGIQADFRVDLEGEWKRNGDTLTETIQVAAVQPTSNTPAYQQMARQLSDAMEGKAFESEIIELTTKNMRQRDTDSGEITYYFR